jgi:tetratricopeptide (TPR) repeat protein
MRRPSRSVLSVPVLALLAAVMAGTAIGAQPDIAWVERARSAKRLEDMGAYTRALALLKQIRAAHAPDVDLEYAIAVDEARMGKLDSAATRLWSPLMEAALADTLPLARRQTYFWERQSQWLNGTFDGWHWHILRARAEVAAQRGDWERAYVAAKLAVDARWHSGKDWQILAIAAARMHRHPEAQRAARHAASLDPTLPEPFYLLGVYAWREGKRKEAQRALREAIRRDSLWAAPALGLVRSRLPAARPDTLPGWLLTGDRRVALVTSPMGPKLEQFVQMEKPAILLRQGEVRFPPGLHLDGLPPPLIFPVLLDAQGRPRAHELPWMPPGLVPEEWLGSIAASLPGWQFSPASRLGTNEPVWVNVEFKMPEQ